MKIKKLLSGLLIAVMAMGLVACGSKGDDASTENSSSETVQKSALRIITFV